MKHSRIIAMIMALVMVFALTACGSETAPETTNAPETTAAPTTEPANVCETNGHSWADATCDVAKTCSVCGETEGEALGHIWMDATYQAPKTCETCGATEGEALVSYFAEHGLDANILDKSGEYDFALPCGTDDTKTTIAKASVEDYKTIASDETHEALDGYEWKILTLKLHFYDENAQKYGMKPPMYFWDDRYGDGAVGEKGDEDGIIDELFTTGMKYAFEWNGVEYNDGLLHIGESVTEWLKDDAGEYYVDIVIIVSVRMPVGYDGFVFSVENTNWEWTEGAYLHEVITDNTLMFCFD